MNVCPLYFSPKSRRKGKEREREKNQFSFLRCRPSVRHYNVLWFFCFLKTFSSFSASSSALFFTRGKRGRPLSPATSQKILSSLPYSKNEKLLLLQLSPRAAAVHRVRAESDHSSLFSSVLSLSLSLSPSPSLSLAHALLSTTERHRIHSYARFPGVDYEREERRIISLLRTWSTGRSEKTNTSIVLEKKYNSNHIDMVSQIGHRQTGSASLFSALVFLDQMSSARDSYFVLLISFSRLIALSVIDCPSVFSCHGCPGLIKPGSMHERPTSSSSSF